MGGMMNTLIMGSKTYQLFERNWVPYLDDPYAPSHMRGIAEELTSMRKMVFSRTMKESRWLNTQFHEDNLIGKVQALKQEAGSDMLILGSGSIVQQLAAEGLIDEYLFIITPVIAGQGKSLFQHASPTELTLVETRTFNFGNVILHYSA